MSNLATLISTLGAGYVGYNKGTRAGEEMNREDARFKAEQDERDYQKEQRDKSRKLEKDVAASQKDIVPEVGATTTGTNLFTDPAAAAYDANEANRMNRQAAENTGTPEPAPIAPAPVARLGTQMFSDPAAAGQAAIGVNSEAEKMKRASKVYSEAGDIDKAKKYQDFAKSALTEGSDQLIAGIQSAAPGVDAVKKAKGGVIKATIGADNAKVFNETGGRWKVQADTPVEYYVSKDAAGREVVNARVLGKDGKPVVDDVRSAGMLLADMKTRIEADKTNMTAFQSGQKITEDVRHNKATEANAAGTLGLARDKLALEKQAAGGLTLDKMEKAGKTIQQAYTEVYQPKEGMTPDEREVLAANRSKTVVQALGIFKQAYALGTPIDEYTAMHAVRLAQDPKNVVQMRHTDGNSYPGVKVNGRFVPVGGPMQSAPAGPAQGTNPAMQQVSAPAAVAPVAARGARPQAPPEGIDVSQDPALVSLRQMMTEVDPNNSDPANVQKIMAIGTAKADRIAQLQQKYGSRTQLLGIE